MKTRRSPDWPTLQEVAEREFGTELSAVEAEHAGATRARWWSTFCKSKQCKQQWREDGMYWHVFSFGVFLHFTGFLANQEYQKSKSRGTLILTGDESIPVYRAARRPLEVGEILRLHTVALAPRYLDLYVCDDKCSWTYVVTHELNMGPYFARSSWGPKQ